MTLYSGNDSKIITHLKKVYNINHRVIEKIKAGMKIKDVYKHANIIFKNNGLTSEVMSITDKLKINIGHSVPGILKPYSKRELTTIQSDGWKKACKIISEKRIFVNTTTDYVLKPDDCLTLEPRLINTQLSYLPTVLFHTIVIIKKNGAEAIENFKEIFQATGMDYML